MASSKANRERFAKACKAMKPFGISKETVKSTLKRLLEVYENNWTYIEDDDYRVLIEAIFAPQEEEEEIEPLQKKARLENQTVISAPCSSNYASGFQQTAETDIETINILEVDEFEGKKPMPLAVIHPSSPGGLLFVDDYWMEKKKSVDLEDENLDGNENGNGNENENENEVEIDIASSCNGEVKKPMPLAVIHPSSSGGLFGDDSWMKKKKSVDLEDENLDEKEKEKEKEDEKEKEKEKENENENEIDIASSFNGEVKLWFCICKPPQGFCIPSVDAVLKQVEDMYQERFKDLGTEFSLSGLLKDMCESLVDKRNAWDDGSN